MHQQNPKGPNIGPNTVLIPTPREPKPANLRHELAVQEDVGQPEVSVNNGLGLSHVEEAQARTNLGGDSDAVVPPEGPDPFAGGSTRGVQNVPQEYVPQATIVHVLKHYALYLSAKPHHGDQMWVPDLAQQQYLCVTKRFRLSAKVKINTKIIVS